MQISPNSQPEVNIESAKNKIETAIKTQTGFWSIASRILLVCAGFLIATMVTELGFRAISAVAAKPISWSDRPAKYYLRNQHDDIPRPEKVSAKEPNVFRILVLGDSFTFGQAMQKSDAYPARIQALLSLAGSKPVEVLNWGVRGYSTTQELALLKKGFETIAPDLVILQITLNDPEIQPYRVTHPYLDEHGRVKLDNPILNHWKSLQFVITRILNSQTHRDYIKYYEDLFNNKETWDPFVGALEGFKSFLTVRHVPLFAVVFPLFSHPINDSYPFTSEHLKVDNELNRLEIPMIDLKNKYKNIPPERLQVIPGLDSHPNEIAHRIATDAIYAGLVKKKLIPEEISHVATVKNR